MANVSVQSRIEAEFGAYEELRDAVDALAFSISIGDKASVAALVRYPLTVDFGGEQKVIEDEQAFVASYDEIVTPQLGGTLISEKIEAAVVVEEGVAIAGGQVELMPLCLPGSCAVRYWLISHITAATSDGNEAEFGADEALRDAVDALAFAISIGDKASVAALVAYPLTVDLESEQKVIEDEQAFIANYERIMTPALAGALISENLEAAVMVEEGVVIAGGQVELMPFCIPGSCAARYWLISHITDDRRPGLAPWASGLRKPLLAR